MKHDLHQSNVDFDYLGDDDDSDPSGPPPTFDALPFFVTPLGEPQSSVGIGVTTPVTGSAQTNGSFELRVSLTVGGNPTAGIINSISTTALDQWTESGWTDLGSGTWQSSYTKAAGVGYSQLTFSIIYNGGAYQSHTLTLDTSSPLPSTTQATGTGQIIDMYIP